MNRAGLVLVLAAAGLLAAGCNVGVRETDQETTPPPGGSSPTPGDTAGEYPGPCPVGTWQLSGIEPAEQGVGTAAGELSFAGGGSMIIELAEDGTWTVTDDGSDPLDATLQTGGSEFSGTATISGTAEGRYASQGDVYLFEDDRASGTVELSAPGYSETLGMEDVLAAIVPTGEATVTCEGTTLTIAGTYATWEFAYLGSSPAGTDSGSGTTDALEIAASGSYDCAGGSVQITGTAGLTVELTGECAEVQVNSAGNQVEIEAAGALVVNGAGNEVDVQRVDAITVTGALSHVTWHGEEPEITNAGSGATVERG